jgi:cell division septation protein DedD
MIDTSLFPYESFGVRLEVKEENKIAWFKDSIDVEKHIARYKLDRRKINVIYRDGEPTQSSKGNKDKIRQRASASDSGSATTTRRSTKNVDSSRDVASTRKPKSSTTKPKPTATAKPKVEKPKAKKPTTKPKTTPKPKRKPKSK